VLQNKGQGLGFKLAGLGVIDNKSMATYAVKLYSALVTVFTTLLTIQGKGGLAAPTAGENECALSSLQTSSIQLAMLERNSSCAYNMTVDSVLGIV
jgi:hypothetical protein